MIESEYTFWEDKNFFLGFLNKYPDYQTQGTSKKDLLDNQQSLMTDIEDEVFSELDQ